MVSGRAMRPLSVCGLVQAGSPQGRGISACEVSYPWSCICFGMEREYSKKLAAIRIRESFNPITLHPPTAPGTRPRRAPRRCVSSKPLAARCMVFGGQAATRTLYPGFRSLALSGLVFVPAMSKTRSPAAGPSLRRLLLLPLTMPGRIAWLKRDVRLGCAVISVRPIKGVTLTSGRRTETQPNASAPRCAT